MATVYEYPLRMSDLGRALRRKVQHKARRQGVHPHAVMKKMFPNRRIANDWDE